MSAHEKTFGSPSGEPSTTRPYASIECAKKSGHYPIKSHSTGRKIHIVYGNVTAAINPAQIIEVQMLPKDETKRLSTSHVLREIAEDYRHLAADAHGNTDDQRRKNYHWLIKLADKIAARHTAVVKD